MTHLLRYVPADLFGYEMRDQPCYQPTVLLRLEVAQLSGLLDGGDEHLVRALLLAGDHLAVVRGADLAGDLLAPRVGLVLDVGSSLGVGRVALGLEPGLANDFCGERNTTFAKVVKYAKARLSDLVFHSWGLRYTFLPGACGTASWCSCRAFPWKEGKCNLICKI